MIFNSDNNAPLHPNVLTAMQQANQFAPAYGADAITKAAVEKIRHVFEAPNAAVFFVPIGTAANALALAQLTQPYQSIYCHEAAHINVDECGAPEFYTHGAKIIPLAGANGKIAPQTLKTALAQASVGSVHAVQPGTLSLTNATESGTVYTPDELAQLCKIAKANGLNTHLDGARFANAVATMGCNPADLSWRAGVDILCFGGTKNGLMGVEAVIIFDPKNSWEFELRRKRAGQLSSKNQYLAAQVMAYLEGELWLDLAKHANTMATTLAAKLDMAETVRVLEPVNANMVFASWPRAMHERALGAGAQYYLWPDTQAETGPMDEIVSVRLVCSWATTAEEVDKFCAALSA